MNKIYTLLWFVCTITIVEAQNVVNKTLVSPDTHFIQIDVAKCFQLNLETYEGDELIVEAIIDGEYKNDLLLDVIEEGQTTLVNTDFRPNFINPNDKLSAHKVISIALKIKMPQYKNVKVYGTGCNVHITGMYKNLMVTLNDGICTLNDVGEEAQVITHSGDIKVENANAIIDATTKYGKVVKNISQKGDYHYKLTSVTGNIYLSKTE
ncbi:hypothetical protein GGR42_001712 [Saonia flava]|uniref:DUF4097 domain-containing protein n=1 Tax=Saonia flava TaxID=523696 RepID=A0A846QWD7_9FLAO|nr:DUF4097 family beta strand repeat-containing protein [Saonia flava]NJB71250.1 hypothetical protein [Saonia flava]